MCDVCVYTKTHPEKKQERMKSKLQNYLECDMGYVKYTLSPELFTTISGQFKAFMRKGSRGRFCRTVGVQWTS